jgi:fructose-bisphosphate aldolase class II
MLSNAQIILRASQAAVAVPAFNIPYLPMMEPVIQAIVDQDAFALVTTARLEWIKFGSKGPAEVCQEYLRWARPDHVRLHLDHIPVIDEDNRQVDFLPIIREAIELGYPSVMIDGSRLGLDENIAATRQVVNLAHGVGVACEAELGAVLGHEAGPIPAYDELFSSGRGFTDVGQCTRFVQETGCDWLSVAIGNIHGAVSGAAKDAKKVEARLNLEHLDRLRRAAGIPLVLHGGTGIRKEYLAPAIQKGIAKVNVAADIRQAYESSLRSSSDPTAARQAVYDRAVWLLREYLGVAGKRSLIAA